MNQNRNEEIKKLKLQLRKHRQIRKLALNGLKYIRSKNILADNPIDNYELKETLRKVVELLSRRIK